MRLIPKRSIMALTLLLSPALGTAAAHAANLSEQSLGAYRSNCVQRCAQKRDAAVCQRACQCMAEEMKQHWTQERYDNYAATLRKSPDDGDTNRMMRQLAAYCYQRIQGR